MCRLNASGFSTSPWGTWPGYLSLLVTDFDRANEKAFGFGMKYDFGTGTLVPLRIPGLTVQILYGQGNDRIDPTTGKAQPTTREGDLDISSARTRAIPSSSGSAQR